MTTDYVGKVVFISGAKQYPQNGEFIIVRQSLNQLVGIKTEIGYGAHELKTLPLIGDSAYEILTVNDDKDFVRKFATELLEWSKSDKKNWIESVYSAAGANARLLLRLIDKDPLPVDKRLTITESKTIEHKNSTVVLSPKVNALIDKFGCQAENVRALIERVYMELLILNR